MAMERIFNKIYFNLFVKIINNLTFVGNSTRQASLQCSNWWVFVFYRPASSHYPFPDL